DRAIRYRHVEISIDPGARTAELVVKAPDAPPPAELGDPRGGPELADVWSLRAFRELDDALLRLRFDLPEIGVVTLRTSGDPKQVIAHDEALAKATTGF